MRYFIYLTLITFINIEEVHSNDIPNDVVTFSNAEKYTVKIRTQINYPFTEDKKVSATGTGFLVNKEKGLILTNAHVVGRSASHVKAMFHDKSYHTVSKVYVDPVLDLAVIKVPVKYIPSSAEQATLDCDKKVNSGYPVGAYGHPWDLSFTATRGIISGTTFVQSAEWIQTDAPINSGNSGGPLISLNTGNVIGISSASLSKAKTEGLNFALPIRYACKVMSLLSKDKDPSPPELGVIFYEVKDNKPLKVAAVVNESTSLFRSGDIILGINGVDDEIKNPFHLYHYLRGMHKPVEINVLREGKKIQTLMNFKAMNKVLERRGVYFSGMFISPTTFQDRDIVGLNGTWMVNFVDKGSSAKSEKIRKWDLLVEIDDKRIPNYDELLEYLKTKKINNKEVTLRIKRLSLSMNLHEYHEVLLMVDDEKIIEIE